MEAIVVGSVVVLAIVTILAAATTLQRARESVVAASQVAAAEAIRTGNLEAAPRYVSRVLPDADVHIRSDDHGVTVTVSRRVEILGMGDVGRRWVEATARAEYSPYRSSHP